MKRLICICLSLMLLASCEEPDQKKVFIGILHDFGSQTQYEHHHYDVNGHLLSVDSYNNDKLTAIAKYTYSEGKAFLRKYYTTAYNNEDKLELIVTNSFQYNSEGKIIEISEVSQSPALQREVLYKMVWEDELISKVERVENESLTYDEYQYDAKGNIEKKISYKSDGSVSFVQECQYDNLKNPLFAVYDPVRFGDLFYSSPNNLISVIGRWEIGGEIASNHEITYTYSNGLPIERKSVFTSSLENSVVNSKYFYTKIEL